MSTASDQWNAPWNDDLSERAEGGTVAWLDLPVDGRFRWDQRLQIVNCSCPCHPDARHPSHQGYPRKCDKCSFLAESWAVWQFHEEVDHGGPVVYSPYRDGVDHWSIDMTRAGESIGQLAFSTEAGWREACVQLGLGDPIAEAEFEAKQAGGEL